MDNGQLADDQTDPEKQMSVLMVILIESSL